MPASIRGGLWGSGARERRKGGGGTSFCLVATKGAHYAVRRRRCRSSCCCCHGRRVLTKVFTSSLVRKCRIHRIPFPACNLSDPHRSCPSSTTISSNYHVPPRPLRISRSPLTPFRCNYPVPHHCCVSSFLGIQPPGRRMSVSVHAFMISLFGH